MWTQEITSRIVNSEVIQLISYKGGAAALDKQYKLFALFPSMVADGWSHCLADRAAV